MTDDPAYRRVNTVGKWTRFGHIVRDIEFWLPNPFEFTFESMSSPGELVGFGSTMTLLRQLQMLNAVTWKADRTTIDQWTRTTPSRDDPLEELAKFGFSNMFFLADNASRRRMPMKLDY